ncbi:MAG TPA: cytochrome c oxidase subunit II [Pseudonocardiaceae bacterium]|jgi:cytochrome c oxidase subunit 2|nr:cytochrome c oxidase subunit II [Pseudonocardiaceae bacterium]
MFFHEVFGRVLTVESAIAGAVFVIIATLLVIAVVRRRATAARSASDRPGRNRLEIAYAIVLAGVAGFLVWFTASANAQDTQHASPAAATIPPQATVEVTAFQWCWRFHYTGRPVTVTGDCAEHHYPVVLVPTGAPVRIQLTSQDVVHSLWIPDLDVKYDAYPDHTNTFDLDFTRPGQWLGKCAEFCGTYHTTMDFYIRAVPPDQYKQWLAAQGGQA